MSDNVKLINMQVRSMTVIDSIFKDEVNTNTIHVLGTDKHEFNEDGSYNVLFSFTQAQN